MAQHEHTVSLRTYLNVFVALVILTGVTYEAAYVDFGSHVVNVVIAMLIAGTKATLVVLFFMHVKYGKRILWVIVGTGFLWLGLLIVGTLHDYLSRGWLVQ
jgi:cytochrome c oxidase subunit 4